MQLFKNSFLFIFSRKFTKEKQTPRKEGTNHNFVKEKFLYWAIEFLVEI
jgi:hypothetical protein